jgi:hypothetical protein
MMDWTRGDGTALRLVECSTDARNRRHKQRAITQSRDEAGAPAATYIVHAPVETGHQRPPIVWRNRIFQERRHVVAFDSWKIVRRQLRAPANDAQPAAALNSSATFTKGNLILIKRILKDLVSV